MLPPTGDTAIWACHAKSTELVEDAYATRRVVARKPACTIAAVEFLEAIDTWSATLADEAHDAVGAFATRSAEGAHALFEAATAPCDTALDAIALQAANQALAAAYDGNQKKSENGAVHAGADLE